VSFTNAQDEGVYRARAVPRDTDVRGDYFRDQAAILHSLDFRRLKRKTQVFFDPENAHICTRIEHVLHVSSIAGTISRALGLDVDLSQAIGMGHDIGHPPFGHPGERVIHSMLGEIGGFHHEVHGLRVVDHLAGGGEGLNLTYAVRDGIICHCGERWEQGIQPDPEPKDLTAIQQRDRYPSTWEGCVVRMSDKIAYLGRDVEDAITAQLIRAGDVPPLVVERLGANNSQIINTLVLDCIDTAERTGSIGFSEGVHEGVLELRNFNYQRIYNAPMVRSYGDHCRETLRRLFEHLLATYDSLGFDAAAYPDLPLAVDRSFGRYMGRFGSLYERRDETGELRVVGDYIAGMTDDFALRAFEELVLPRPIRSW
jgi:dGTPase